MSKLQRKYIADDAVDATKVDLADDYAWTGEHDFTGGTVEVATPTSGANPLTYAVHLAKSNREPCFVRAQGNLDLSAPGSTIDGQSMSVDQRVCCDQQTTTTQDGIYLWKGASTPMVRATDFAVGMSVSLATFGIQTGTDAYKRFEITNVPGSDVVGTDALTVRQITGEPERISNLMSTGLLTGGVVTKHGADPTTTIDVSAGVGYIVNNYTDPENPVRTRVEWDAMSDVTVTYLATSTFSYFAIDSNGDLLEFSSRPDTDDWRDYIMLAAVGHENHSYLTNISPVVNVAYDVQQQTLEFIDWFGDFKVSGNEVTAYATDLRVTRSAGACFKRGGNYYNSAKNVNTIANAAGSPQYLVGAYRNTSGVWVPTSYTYYLDPEHYDPGSDLGLVDVPTGKWTNQYLFKYAAVDLILVVQYGQAYYDDKATALAHMTDSFIFDPDLSSCVFLGYVTIKQGTTDDSDTDYCVFTPSGKFGLATMISGGGSGEVNTASNIGTSGVGVYAQKSGVDLQFKNVKAASTKVTVTDNPTPHTIDIDITPGNIAHQDLSGAGTNTHSNIDSHISSTSNPHSTTASQVGLGNVTNDAQIKASDFPSSSVDSEIALFSSTTGKVIKRATTTGIVKATSGVISAAVSGTDYEPPIATGVSPQFYGWDKTWRIPAWPKNYIDGLGITRTSASQLTIEVGRCRSSDDTFNMELTGTVTAALSSSGVGGLDTGSEASSTWYYLWLIYNSGTTTYAAMFSTSSSSPTMPSGYTLKRRVGSWYNNSSSDLRNATQIIASGSLREYLYNGETSTTLRLLNEGTAGSFTDVNCSAFIPPVSTLGIFELGFRAGGSNSDLMNVRTNGSSVDPPLQFQWGSTSDPLYTITASSTARIPTDASQIIEYRAGSGNYGSIWVIGYVEQL